MAAVSLHTVMQASAFRWRRCCGAVATSPRSAHASGSGCVASPRTACACCSTVGRAEFGELVPASMAVCSRLSLWLVQQGVALRAGPCRCEGRPVLCRQSSWTRPGVSRKQSRGTSGCCKAAAHCPRPHPQGQRVPGARQQQCHRLARRRRELPREAARPRRREGQPRRWRSCRALQGGLRVSA